MDHAITNPVVVGFRHDVTRCSQLGYACSIGLLTGALFGSLDALVTCGRGSAVVWSIPPAIVGTYLMVGLLMGAVVAFLGAAAAWVSRARSVPRDQRSVTRACCLAAWVGLVALFFSERLHRGHLGGFALHLFPTSLGIAVATFLLSWGILARIGVRPDGPAALALQVSCLAAATLFWEPFNSLYVAPALSFVGIAAVIGYVLVWTAACAGVLKVAQRMRWRRRDDARVCLSAAVIVAVVGAVASSTVTALQVRRPIELPYRAGVAPVARAFVPDIVLIVMDTTRADHLTAYGYHRNTTPHVAAFASEAVVYWNAVSTSSWTLPAHGSLFTGLLPTEHGADLHHRTHGVELRGLAEEHLTLAEMLLAHGYDTGAVMGNTAVLTRDLGFDQGFLYFDDRERLTVASADLPAPAPSRWLTEWWQHSADTGKRFNYGGRQFRYYWRFAGELTDTALDWLARDVAAPTFLFINYMDPHDPYRSHPEFAAQIGLAVPPHASSTRDHATEMDRYDGEIAYVDSQLGRLFAALKRSGRFDESLIIITSDHGEAFGEHGCFGHSNSLYQEEIHIPLIVRYPGARERGIREERISLADVPGLILHELGLPASDAMAASRSARGDKIVAELRPGRSHGGPADGEWIMRAAITPDEVKVIESARYGCATQVFDLGCDPLEMADLRDERVDIEQITLDWLAGWTQSAHARRLTGVRHAPVDEAVRRKLAALGYLD